MNIVLDFKPHLFASPPAVLVRLKGTLSGYDCVHGLWCIFDKVTRMGLHIQDFEKRKFCQVLI